MTRIVLVLLLCAFCCACGLGKSSFDLRSDLVNQGPLAVVADNKFVAANLFLDNEEQKSPRLRQFLKATGRPDIVELKQGNDRRLSLLLYYLKQKQYFVLLEAKNDWLMSVATPLDPERVAELSRYVTFGAASRFGLEDAEIVHVPAKADPTNASQSTAHPAPAKPSASVESSDIPKLKPIAPRQDIQHRVEHPAETLEAIVSWYVGDNKHLGAIARMNGLKKNQALDLGQTIRIPGYLVKTTAPLPKAAIERNVH